MPIRAALVAPLIVVLSGLVPITTPSPAQAHDAKTWWTVPVPFGTSEDYRAGYDTIRGARAKFQLQDVTTDSKFYLTDMRWKGWGTKKAVGKGTSQRCDDYGCQDASDVKFILTKLQKFDCADGLSGSDPHKTYRRARVWGLDYIEDGFTQTVPVGVTRC